jgi:hypothetical protein
MKPAVWKVEPVLILRLFRCAISHSAEQFSPEVDAARHSDHRLFKRTFSGLGYSLFAQLLFKRVVEKTGKKLIVRGEGLGMTELTS